ncbi:MAG: DUF420 domain-containing protein [Planctomycetota bacterium]|nr:DUF420 domain-containing protein [Planctomycetota bacterium]MDA1211821.1 DUF420 domain-containing protein [Planctomycetota bacterium]
MFQKICITFAVIIGLASGVANAQTASSLQPVRVLTPQTSIDERPLWDPRGIQDFELIERSGETVTKNDLLGKPWAISFIFTRCRFTCPQVTTSMRELQQALKEQDVRLISLTVDPETDTPEQLANYADAYGADPDKWLFLTGNRIEIYDLIKRSFRMPVKVISQEDFLHTNNVLYVDAEGVVRGKYDSLKPDDMVELRKVLQGKKPPQMTLTVEEFAEKYPALAAAPPNEPIPTHSDDAPDRVKGKGASKDIVSAEQREKDEIIFADPPADMQPKTVPAWVLKLPAVNALLNGLATVLLIQGFVFIKQRRISAHKNTMLAAFAVSIAFLACYVVYHVMLQQHTGSGSKPFQGTGIIRPIYFSILISHVVLAAVVPVLAIRTIYLGLCGRFEAHKKWARWTFPIWVYVSVTGVMIYGMLYHWPVAAA